MISALHLHVRNQSPVFARCCCCCCCCCCCWSLLYSAILRSWAGSLRSHVILLEWLAFYSAFQFEYQPKWCTYRSDRSLKSSSKTFLFSRFVFCFLYWHIRLVFFLTLYAFGSCFRTATVFSFSFQNSCFQSHCSVIRLCVCVCVRACVRAYVRACVLARALNLCCQYMHV